MSHQDTPSIIDLGVTRFRGGQSLRYRELTAEEKCQYLFEAGIRPTAYENYPRESRPDVTGGLFQFSLAALQSVAHHLLAESLTRESDELATPKVKLFHTYGSTARVLFRPEPGTPYSGLFAAPAHGLARFSYAGPVIGVGIVPGLGLKFPIDGDHPSENAVLMAMLDPQKGHSAFENLFTNILPTPRLTNLVMRAVRARFETVVVDGRGLHQPVENLARVHVDGRPAREVRAPHRLILVPTEAARKASDPGLDMRDDLARNVPSGTTLYDVLGLDGGEEAKFAGQDVDALAGRARKIGTLATESEFIASKYGDYRLFFKHSHAFLRDDVERPRSLGH